MGTLMGSSGSMRYYNGTGGQRRHKKESGRYSHLKSKELKARKTVKERKYPVFNPTV